jgi:hypothetical protein
MVKYGPIINVTMKINVNDHLMYSPSRQLMTLPSHAPKTHVILLIHKTLGYE